MTQISYSEIADQTIRKFLKAVVLIDDHWLEAQNVPVFESIAAAPLLNLEPQTIPPQEGVDSTTARDAEISTVSTSITDPAYLREIGKEITNQGLLFTGFAYTDALKETAFHLASKSDILILDWHLGNVDSRPALALLEKLKNSGSPRFIFILTDQNLAEVRTKITEQLGGATGEDGLVFSCGPFSFSLKNKPQADSPDSVLPTQVLGEAISGIRARFGGLLQLAALELLGQYRDCLHEVLDHFHSDTDFPFILEWLEGESPIRDSHSFNALAIDEWTARVFRRFPPAKSLALTSATVSACLKNWHETADLPENPGDKLRELVKDEIKSFPQDEQKASELIKSLDDWLDSSNSSWPESLASSFGKDNRRVLAMNYLGIRKGVTSPADTLIALDALFQCQANLPPKIEQGTVLQAPGDIFLICITPSCDCIRPARINNCYMFLEAIKLETSMLKKYPESNVVAIRTANNENMLLGVSPKPTFTYLIPDSSVITELHAYATCGGDNFFTIKPIAQLRPSRIQSLISLAAGKAIEVGLDRSELLRQLCQ